MAEPLLEARALRAGYGAVEVLRGVELVVGAAESVALLGSNGVGKSTFAGVVSGLARPWSGTVRFAGESVGGLDARALVERGLIHVPEGRHVFPNLTVRENLELGSYRRGGARRAANLERVAAIFPRLAERTRQKAGTLSGGEQQMLAIGRGLMAEPVLLILDEPSIGLSPLLVEEMFALIRRLSDEGLAILLVEQNVLQSLEIADRGCVLENGEIRLEGPADALIDDPALRRAYLGLA